MQTAQPPILNKWQTLQKIRRIAYQIYEGNFEETEIVFAGIYDRGYRFAQLLRDEFVKIAPIPANLVKISIDKANPMQSEVHLDCPPEFLAHKVVIMTDDVLYSGRTFSYSLKPILDIPIKRLQTAVVVDRGHQQFPIAADYVGYALSTTIRQRIEVELFDDERFGVYLS
jgi:pyrimidine operon attenuation protein / uracil phosphoribosyltransferase